MQTTQHLTWIPRKYGSPLGFITAPGQKIVARNVRRAAAQAMFPEASISYDSYGMGRKGPDGTSLADKIAREVLDAKT